MTTEKYADRLLPLMGDHIKAFLAGHIDQLELARFDDDAMRILSERYLIKDDEGNVIESQSEFLARVALGVQYEQLIVPESSTSDSTIESIYEVAVDYYNHMARLDFLPGSPTLMNAGTPIGQLSACFVVPVGDSMPEIMDAVKAVALIHQSGGGTGMDFSGLRPQGSPVKSTQGVASGPISFMKVFDATTEQIKQGGKRRGANMGMLRVDHPDIEKFIVCKDDDVSLQNFNISVAITSEFMAALNGRNGVDKYDYHIIDPKTGAHQGHKDAREIWDMIVQHAYNTGDPGIIFIDRINQDSPFDLDVYPQHLMRATNPCGEQPLEPYEACNLGSVNLINFVEEWTEDGKVLNGINTKTLHEAVSALTRMLDDVVTVSNFPMQEITDKVHANRKVGLGVMGWADTLLRMGIRYGSEESIVLAREVMGFIHNAAQEASMDLAEERGAFPTFAESVYDIPMRNATLTTIAPTGTISMIANGTSSGVEPVFAFTYTKKVMDGKLFKYVHPEIEEQIIDGSGVMPVWWDYFLETGVLSDTIKKAFPHFVGAMDVTPEEHVRMQAAFQEFTDNAVSKTINLPNSATIEDVDAIYRLAYESGCKGTTIYRDGSKSDQVLFTGDKSENDSTSEDEVPWRETVERLFKENAVILREGEFDDFMEMMVNPEGWELTKHGEEDHGCSGNCSCDKQLHATAKRPEVMLGYTAKTDTPCGHLYVTINIDDEGRPFEVFCKLGKSGACAGAVQETMGRLISQELRSGGDITKIIKQLRGASCGQQVGMGPKRVTSCIDAIGLVLQNYVDGYYSQALISEGLDEMADGEYEAPVDRPVDLPAGSLTDGPGAMRMTESYKPKSNHGACPECGSPMEHEGGCATCRACGFSKCL